MDNRIKITQGDNGNISCFVVGIDDLTNFSSQLTIKLNEENNTVAIILIGEVNDPSGTLVFPYTTEDTSIEARDYIYDVDVSGNGIHKTIVKDILSILQSVHNIV
jgi:hypothetical protein